MAAQTQKKPNAKNANARKSAPAKQAGKQAGKQPGKQAGSKQKKNARELEEARRQALLGRAYFLGCCTLLLLALAIIPGQNIWLTAHTAVWGFFGLPLVFWAVFSFWCCGVWMRGGSPGTASLLGKALLILLSGSVLFLLVHDSAALASEDWRGLVQSVYFEEPPLIEDIMGCGGYFGAAVAVGLARACGRAGAMLVSLVLMLGSAPLAFARLRERLVEMADDWSARRNAQPEQPGKPERMAAPERMPERMPGRMPGRQGKQKRSPIEDGFAELERMEQALGAAAGTAPLHPVSSPLTPEAGLPNTVMNLDPVREDALKGDALKDDAGAGTLAEGLADNPKRKKARQAGDEAVRAAMGSKADQALAEDGRDYQPPPLSCLAPPRTHGAPDRGEEELIARKLVYTLDSFGVQVELVGRSRGPSVTRYELRPAEGVKISKITSLADDIALRLAATKVRIEAPIPGKPAVGVEVPNRVRAIVSLRELVDSDDYRKGAGKSKLTVALGRDIVGDLVLADLAKLPHLLIAGTTGSGKSVCMNALILSLLYNASPGDIKLLMVDPKQVEFNVYSGIPHLLVPVVSDPLKAAGALGWAVNEMEKRYSRISEQNVRDLDSYNNIAAMQDDLEHMPKIVIFIDELSDLMMVAPSDVEDSIQRLTQKGRAAGIHLVVATQRPSIDVITGVIKSNLPGRIALSVASQIDSRTIINSSGAEQLLGNGDMLFSLNGGNNAVRVQGCFVSDPEVRKVVDFVKAQDQGEEGYDSAVWDEIERNAAAAGRGKKKGGTEPGESADESDPMLPKAVEVVVAAQLASTTMLQKKLSLGYARASRLIDLLEEKGIVGPPEGSKPRKVLISHAQWQEYLAAGAGELRVES